MDIRFPRRILVSAVVLAGCLYASGAFALIVGNDAEATALKLEAEGKFREAAVWRLVGARGYRELIIPWEVENVRAYSETHQDGLAAICAHRAEVLYPQKVRENLRLYEEDLKQGGGEAARKAVEEEALDVLTKYAPIPLAVPSRLSDTEEEEQKGNWALAADYREVGARIFLLITVPFFEKESDRAPNENRRDKLQRDALKYLELARDDFVRAAENYRRAVQPLAGKEDANSRRLSAFYTRKAAEMEAQAQMLTPLVAAKKEAGKSGKPAGR
jgi:hypothetical protein